MQSIKYKNKKVDKAAKQSIDRLGITTTWLPYTYTTWPSEEETIETPNDKGSRKNVLENNTILNPQQFEAYEVKLNRLCIGHTVLDWHIDI